MDETTNTVTAATTEESTTTTTDTVNTESTATAVNVVTEPTAAPAEELISLDKYVEDAKPNEGLVASFKAESKNDKVSPRSFNQWQADFNVQSNRTYI